MREPDCGSDHYLVRAKAQLRLKQAKCSKMRAPAKIRHVATKQKFQIALSNKFSVLESSDNTDKVEKELSKSILECATYVRPLNIGYNHGSQMNVYI